MDVLKQVGDQVGPLEVWPTYILLHMFVDKLNDAMLKVSAFVYGNGVDEETAGELFATCNSAPLIGSAMLYAIGILPGSNILFENILRCTTIYVKVASCG
jgi:hypothetical protein